MHILCVIFFHRKIWVMFSPGGEDIPGPFSAFNHGHSDRMALGVAETEKYVFAGP
jgi:hypothetical protein